MGGLLLGLSRCDRCGARVREETEGSLDPESWESWHTLRAGIGDQQHEWHFCSRECAKKWLEKHVAIRGPALELFLDPVMAKDKIGGVMMGDEEKELTPAKVDDILRKAGYDPYEVEKGMRAAAMQGAYRAGVEHGILRERKRLKALWEFILEDGGMTVGESGSADGDGL